MGADRFETESTGKDFDEAFQRAVDNAFYDYGHAGYTGSICEKPGAYLIPTPKGMKAYDVMNVILDAQGIFVWDAATESQAAAFKQVVKWFGQDEAEKIVNMSDDKWDDAVGIELADDEYGLTPVWHPIPKNEKRFLFFGWASC